MQAANIPLVIPQGTTYEKKFTWTINGSPVNLTGYDARMQVRGKIADATALLDLNVSNGGIILGGAAGTIELFMNDTDTSALTWTQGVYDLELIDTATKVRRFIEGEIIVTLEVTR